MLCVGCGELLTNGSKRGRPARYHDATCRQRAHRARRAVQHDAALSALANLETATSELRHALTANQDVTLPHGHVIDAMAELARQLERVTPIRDQAPATTAIVTESVTTSSPATVTNSASTTRPTPTSDIGHTVPDQPGPSAIDVPPARITKTIDMRDSIGPGWTLVQYEGDADASIWRVHHNGQAVGTVCRNYDLATNTRGWEARTSRYLQVPAIGNLAANRRSDRLWRTRDSAAAGIAALQVDRNRRQTRPRTDDY